MLKIRQNWGKIANYPPQCSTKIGTPVSMASFKQTLSLVPVHDPDYVIYQLIR